MRAGCRIAVVIPALDEAAAIGPLLAEIPAWVDRVLVVDNGSRDGTARIARSRGVQVVAEPRRGYGAACLKGIAALAASDIRPDILVFMDGDGSDRPSEMAVLIDPLIRDQADLVIGSRVLGSAEFGALTPQQRLGNGLACLMMRLIWGIRYSDLGPYRAITAPSLAALAMQDRDFGWTVEMQVKAARRGLRCLEVPITCRRRRDGQSKVSGTLLGSLRAGWKIMAVICGAALRPAAH